MSEGKIFAEAVEIELKKQGKTKGEFYDAVGVTATALYGWKNGAIPKKDTVIAVQRYLGPQFMQTLKAVSFQEDKNDDDVRELLRSREDLRILLNSAKDVPASSVFALISQLEKMKEDANQS